MVDKRGRDKRQVRRAATPKPRMVAEEACERTRFMFMQGARGRRTHRRRRQRRRQGCVSRLGLKGSGARASIAKLLMDIAGSYASTALLPPAAESRQRAAEGAKE